MIGGLPCNYQLVRPISSRLEIAPHPNSQHFYPQWAFARGGQGELWIGRRTDILSSNEEFVLKRAINSKETALREIYFGQKLSSSARIGRFMDWFEDGDDLWLVFKNEGISLSRYIYEQDKHGLQSVGQHWREMKTRNSGSLILSLVRDVLEAVAGLHALGITHRDVKPANVLVREEDGRLRAVLIDMGSAVNDESLRTMYSMFGPSLGEQTLDYAPPEVLLSPEGSAPYYLADPSTYDMWSVGVLFLELVLGTSKVFQVSDKVRAMLEERLRDESPRIREQAILFRAYVEYCLYEPHEEDGAAAVSVTSQCALDSIAEALDPLGLGIPGDSSSCVELLIRLLAYHPMRRISAAEALEHRCLLLSSS
jgi:serine/threonine protein kinase